MSRAVAIMLTLLAGVLAGIQPATNALLGRVVSDLGAAFMSLVISTAIVAALLVTVGDSSQLKGIDRIRPEYLVGGLAGAMVVTVSLIAVRVLGASGVTAALVVMMLIVSAVLDERGLLGLDVSPLGWQGWTAIVLLLTGTFLMTTRA